MSDPTTTPSATDDPSPPPQSPGERRLAHPPSDRYRVAADTPAAATPDPAASIPRGAAIATVVAIVGAIAIVVLGGALAVTLGLVVVAGAIGWGTGMALRFGAGDHLTRRGRWVGAVVLTVTAVALGQLGLWQYARTEGGVLSPLDYLGEVYGPLVPLEFAVAAVVAWLTAR